VTVRCTRRSLTENDNARCCINTILPPEDEQDIPRNMYRIVINVLKLFVHEFGHWLRLDFSFLFAYYYVILKIGVVGDLT
jgi:hypothetical protein